MCDSYQERLYWIRRVEQLRKEMEQAEEPLKQARTATPAKPAAPQTEVQEQPVPA